MAQLLEQTIGIQARVGLAGHEPNHAALITGDIDLYADYLGTALRRYLGLQPRRSAAATYRAVRDAARRRWRIEWLPAFGFNNTYAVIVPAALAQRLQLQRVTDLVAHAPHLRLGATEEVLAPGSNVSFAPGGYAACARRTASRSGSWSRSPAPTARPSTRSVPGRSRPSSISPSTRAWSHSGWSSCATIGDSSPPTSPRRSSAARSSPHTRRPGQPWNDSPVVSTTRVPRA